MSKPLTRQFVQDISAGDEAYYVALHAIRQQQHGRNPSLPYLWIYNPRVALQRALDDLGFRDLSEFRRWSATYALPVRHQRLEMNYQPIPRDVVTDLSVRPAALLIVEPRNPRRYTMKLDLVDRPASVMITIRDADERQFKLRVRIYVDMMPNQRRHLVLRGRVRMRHGIKVRTFNGELRALFPGQSVRVQIASYKGRYVLEFL